MNKFGSLFNVSVFGESHGESVGVVIDGCPAGVDFPYDLMKEDLKRRQGGKKGTTERCEKDRLIVKSGVFEEKTTGAPILIMFNNEDVRSADYEKIKNTPRPGHADMTAKQKFNNCNDYRGGGHFSGRLTVGIVAAGALAKTILKDIIIEAKVINKITIDPDDSVGGLVECRVKNVPVGLGEPFFNSVESLISHAVFSIPGIKGIEFGVGFDCISMRGSEYNDEIIDVNGKTKTNHSGGINGGITNGNDIIFRVAVRPTASIAKPQKTINLETSKTTDITIEGRHDSCIALRMPVILEATTAIVLTDLFLKSNYGTRRN